MRTIGSLGMALALAACGDNLVPDGEPIGDAPDVVVVARASDALARMQPDLAALIARRRGVTILELARDAGAARAAIGELVGDSAWRCGDILVEGHVAQHCVLPSARTSIVSLGLSDPTPLWTGASERVGGYDRDQLADTLAAAIGDTHAHTLRTLDPLADGADGVAGAAAVIAVARAASPAAIVLFLASSSASARVAVGVRARATGRLTADGAQCMAANSDGSLALVPCAGAPSWTATPDGHLALDATHCLQALPTDELVVGSCGTVGIPAPPLAFRLADDGRIWASTLPIVGASGTIEGDLACLIPAGGRVRARGCTATSATWTVLPAIATTARPTTTLTASGRALQLADLLGDDGRADLCEIDAGGLRCAPGAGDGTFGIAARVDAPARPLGIAPTSLALGDLDGDGVADACGRVQSGVLCALSSASYQAAPWSDAFGAPAIALDPSFAVANADGQPGRELCAAADGAIRCVRHDGPTAPAPLTTAIAMAPAAWIVDLDGDGRADWCAALPAGLACGLAADTAPAGPPSIRTAVKPAPDALAFADLDGDGLADYVRAVDASTLVWARGQGFGFGPEIALPGLAGKPVLGDLDGDGVADACTDQLACARF